MANGRQTRAARCHARLNCAQVGCVAEDVNVSVPALHPGRCVTNVQTQRSRMLQQARQARSALETRLFRSRHVQRTRAACGRLPPIGKRACVLVGLEKEGARVYGRLCGWRAVRKPHRLKRRVWVEPCVGSGVPAWVNVEVRIQVHGALALRVRREHPVHCTRDRPRVVLKREHEQPEPHGVCPAANPRVRAPSPRRDRGGVGCEKHAPRCHSQEWRCFQLHAQRRARARLELRWRENSGVGPLRVPSHPVPRHCTLSDDLLRPELAAMTIHSSRALTLSFLRLSGPDILRTLGIRAALVLLGVRIHLGFLFVLVRLFRWQRCSHGRRCTGPRRV